MILIRKSFLNFFTFFILYNTLVSCEAIFEEDISEKEVILLAPANNVSVATGPIRFDWESIAQDSIRYQIQIASPNFENASQIVLDSTLINTSIIQNLEIGDYEWRVRAKNSAYSSAYSINGFTVN